ncbi:hypothetical protein LCGC14_3096540 [marine sediment metagenome]|uniref:Uncharacterized protein n=1 Tax=marine sediment metagenome TaxID=412755 RepID=A0A0F8YGG2_9ZZZZ
MADRYKDRWGNLIAEIIREVVAIEKKPEKSIEDEWIEGTLHQVLRKMCALDRLPPKLWKLKKELTRNLFED